LRAAQTPKKFVKLLLCGGGGLGEKAGNKFGRRTLTFADRAKPWQAPSLNFDISYLHLHTTTYPNTHHHHRRHRLFFS
jgi:hypothetical protein